MKEYLRKPGSRWAVAYRGTNVPWIVRGWHRWRWQAARDLRRRVTRMPSLQTGRMFDLRVVPGRVIDEDWHAFDPAIEIRPVKRGE